MFSEQSSPSPEKQNKKNKKIKFENIDSNDDSDDLNRAPSEGDYLSSSIEEIPLKKTQSAQFRDFTLNHTHELTIDHNNEKVYEIKGENSIILKHNRASSGSVSEKDVTILKKNNSA